MLTNMAGQTAKYMDEYACTFGFACTYVRPNSLDKKRPKSVISNIPVIACMRKFLYYIARMGKSGTAREKSCREHGLALEATPLFSISPCFNLGTFACQNHATWSMLVYRKQYTQCSLSTSCLRKARVCTWAPRSSSPSPQDGEDYSRPSHI